MAQIVDLPELERDHYYVDYAPKVSPEDQKEIDIINLHNFPRYQAMYVNGAGKVRILQRIFVVPGARVHWTRDAGAVTFRTKHYRLFITDDSGAAKCRLVGMEQDGDGKQTGSFDCAPSEFVKWLAQGGKGELPEPYPHELVKNVPEAARRKLKATKEDAFRRSRESIDPKHIGSDMLPPAPPKKKAKA
jgi:hypothetical protein